MSNHPPYEKREKFFACRFTRILQKSCAAQEIGRDACLLLVFIVHTEDRADYKRPVMFWNSQLMETIGFRSPKQLNNARQAAIDAGWLIYWRDGTRSVGHYFVRIPDRHKSIKDTPIEPADEHSIHSTGGTNSGTNNPLILSAGGMRSGTNSGTNSGKLSLPVPVPVPKRVAPPRFVPPTIEAVRSYCRERKNSVDPEKFLDHYTANGWVQGKGKPIRDWQAAVRTWERNGLSTNGDSTNGKTSSYPRLEFK